MAPYIRMSKENLDEPAAETAEASAGAAGEHHPIVIVGGGPSGLMAALRLCQAGREGVSVYESRGGVGGRVVTTRNADGSCKWNNFAWRVGETNTKMLALAKELGIELREHAAPSGKAMDFHTKGSQEDGGANGRHPDAHETPSGRAPLSAFATYCLDSTMQADKTDRESGYAGRTAQIAFPHESHGSLNYVPINGMHEFPAKLAAALPEGMVKVNHRARDVKKLKDGRYRIDMIVRDGNSYSSLVVTCDTLILAAPPCSLRKFSIAAHGLDPVLFAIHERRLCHGYAKVGETDLLVPDASDGTKPRIYHNFPNSILQQVISGDYGQNIFQAGYACDRFERVWRELQFQGPEVVKKEIEKQLKRVEVEGYDLANLPIAEVHFQMGFVHRWQIEAHVDGKTKEELEAQAVYPQPVSLPQLFLVGEAYSSQQGWTEGALRTAEIAVEHILKRSPHQRFSAPLPMPKEEKGGRLMVYKGLVLDVAAWKDRHPGGPGMIFGHGGEDVSWLFDNFHANWAQPLATIFGMQVGVAEQAFTGAPPA